MKLQLDEFLQLRARKDELQVKLKATNKRIEELTDEIAEQMEEVSAASIKGDMGHTISVSYRTYPKVEDYSAYYHWGVTEGGQFVGNYWNDWQESFKMKGVTQQVIKTIPNQRLAGIIIKHCQFEAIRDGKDLRDVLPPGLGMYSKRILTVRQPTKKGEFEAATKSLLDRVKQEAGK